MPEKYYMIGNKAYVVVIDYKNGYNYEAFRDRYSEVLDRYDYIVGDWGYSQLRLKGFFREDNPKATKETSIATLQDYLNEYCNFGCAYFVVEKVSHPPADGEIVGEPAASADRAVADPTAGGPSLPMRYNRTGVAARMTAADRSYAEDYAWERRRPAAREAGKGDGAWEAPGRGRESSVGRAVSESWTSGAAVSSNGRPGGRDAGFDRVRSRDDAGIAGRRHDRDKLAPPGSVGPGGAAARPTTGPRQNERPAQRSGKHAKADPSAPTAPRRHGPGSGRGPGRPS